jgi:pyrophosphatase PpaX
MAIDALPDSTRLHAEISCVLFDLDGTLIDTTDLIFRSYQHALASVLDAPASPAELFLGYGQPLYAAFGSILAHRQVQLAPDAYAHLVQRLVTAYRTFNVAEHDRLTRPFPGVSATLGELKARHYHLGLVTSKSREIAWRGLRLIGVADHFETAVFLEDTERHKPNPDPLWLALERLGRRDNPARALYVGDSTHDVRAGQAAGVRTAAALWGPFPPESLLALGPDFALAAASDLLAVLPGSEA